ncbi:MAG: aspartate/glutamate racemase family protein, partial [Oleibacter sp.]|nr:aspartate/glutamate racemase family protein [Thalassolituus sp.]
MKNSMLIFDSGVGGLSILQEVARLMPDITLDYLMDSEFFPYGIREDQELIQRIVTFCKAAVEQRQPSVLILACNTASTLALPALREILSIPVVGVVPAIRVAGERSLSLKDDGPATIGLLATPATVNRPYTQDLIEQFAPHCEVQ